MEKEILFNVDTMSKKQKDAYEKFIDTYKELLLKVVKKKNKDKKLI